MAESATVAAVKRIRSRCMRNKFHYRRSPRLDREAIFGRTEDEARITFCLRAIGIKIELESMRPIERCDFQLHFGAQLYADGRRAIFILFGCDFDDLHSLVLLSSISRTGKVCGYCEPTENEQANNSRYVIHFYSFLKMKLRTQITKPGGLGYAQPRLAFPRIPEFSTMSAGRTSGHIVQIPA